MVDEASRAHELTPSELYSWVDEGRSEMQNALRARPEDVHEHYKRQLRDLQQAYGESILELRARKKAAALAGQGRQMILRVQQASLDEGLLVRLSALCEGFGVQKHTTHYRLAIAPLKVNDALTLPSKAMMDENPSFGDLAVSHLLRMNKKLHLPDQKLGP